jgi:putative FmdB family regulatory protein
LPNSITNEEFSVPIYEYQCGACKHKFEIIQKVSDDLLAVCPKCKEEKLRKLVTAASFRLKGSGWYATDFKDKKAPQQAGKDQAKTETGAKGETSGPATSKDSKSSASDTGKKPSSPENKPSKSTKNSPD